MNKLLTLSTLLSLSLSSTVLYALEEGDSNGNAFFGVDAGANTSNTFSGRGAGFNTTIGRFNTFSGRGAGFSNTTGSANTFLGAFAGENNTSGSFNIFLGFTAGDSELGSNKLYIESDVNSAATPLIYGDFATDLVGINGILGIGTQLPTSTLHVLRADGTAKAVIEETSATVAARTLFELRNTGNTKFSLTNTDADVEWAPTNSGSDFRISRQGSGAVEFRVSNEGNLTIQGNLTELSSREEKHNIVAINSEQVLNKVLALPINEWTYNDSQQNTRHVGPMAEDFHAAFGLGESATGIATLDTSGVALAAIQGLDKKLSEKDAEIMALKTEQVALQQSKAQQDKKLTQQDKDMAVMQTELAELSKVKTELAELKALVQRLAVKDQWALAN